MSRLGLTSVRVVMAMALAGSLTTGLATAHAQPTEVKGEAILKHPVGILAVKLAELLSAGRADEAIALRTKAEQSDWKRSPADERKEMGDLMKSRAPEPKAYMAALRTSGVLKVTGDEAELRASIASVPVIAYFEREGGEWRGVSGPISIGEAPEPANEVRITGAALAKHPVAALAVKYVELVHAGKMDEAMAMASTSAQAAWQAGPASERKASADFRRKMLPARAEFEAALQSGSILIVEGDQATLNVVRTTQSGGGGTVTSSSSTMALPFVMEGGVWKLAQ